MDIYIATCALTPHLVRGVLMRDFPDIFGHRALTSPKCSLFFIQSYLIASVTVLTLAYNLVKYFDPEPLQRIPAHVEYFYPKTGAFLGSYYLLLLVSRWMESDSHVLYEQVRSSSTSRW